MSLNFNKKECTINLNVDIITDETNSKILTSFIKFFLLHYNIIPFRLENFTYYADGFKKQLSNDDSKNIDDDWNKAQINKQQELVIELSDDINYLIREIHLEFKSSLVTEVAVLYGTTVLTPKEIYVFRFPINTLYHLSENHSVNDGTILRCLTQFINEISNVNQKTKISNNTNLYILYKKSSHGGANSSQCDGFLNNEISDIMESCPNKYLFHLYNENEGENYVPLNCCKELIVYEDLCNLNLMEGIKENYDKERIGEAIDAFEWWQSKITIKRYECRKIRGKEVWEYL